MQGIINGSPLMSNGAPMSGICTVMDMATTRSTATPFGERLLAAMAHSGLTQLQIAKKAGISQSTLGEAYRHDASKHTVQIALACGVSPVWLATGQGEMLGDYQALRPEVRAVAEEIDALPDRLRNWALNMVRQTLEVALEPPQRQSNGLGDIPNSQIPATKHRKSA